MTAQQTPLRRAFAEAKALRTLLDAVEHDGPTAPVVKLVQVLRDAELQNLRDSSDWLRHNAMAKVLGEFVLTPVGVFPTSDVDRFFHQTFLVWSAWAAGRVQEAQDLMPKKVPEQGSELHLMALRPWYEGLKALSRDDAQEARRLFRRSTEIGGQLGTETNNAIQWAYGATFFTHRPTS